MRQGGVETWAMSRSGLLTQSGVMFFLLGCALSCGEKIRPFSPEWWLLEGVVVLGYAYIATRTVLDRQPPATKTWTLAEIRSIYVLAFLMGTMALAAEVKMIREQDTGEWGWWVGLALNPMLAFFALKFMLNHVPSASKPRGNAAGHDLDNML
jgi:hypothetical protein